MRGVEKSHCVKPGINVYEQNWQYGEVQKETSVCRGHEAEQREEKDRPSADGEPKGWRCRVIRKLNSDNHHFSPDTSGCLGVKTIWGINWP